MNQIIAKFKERIDDIDYSDDEKLNALHADIRQYARENELTFKSELIAIMYDQDTDYAFEIFDALSQDLEYWQQLYKDALNDIIKTGKNADRTDDALWILSDIMNVFEKESPVILKLAQVIIKEMDTDMIPFKVALIKELTFYLDNPILRNNASIVDKLQQHLYDDNRKVRIATHTGLKDNNLLPSNFKISLMDRILAYF
jgi:hypothetical protein